MQIASVRTDAGDSSTVSRQLLQAAGFFDSQKGYKDSAALAQHCRKRSAEIMEENARIVAELYALEQAKAAKAAAAKKKKALALAGILSVIAVICIIAAFVMVTVVIPNSRYEAAVELMENGHHDEAIAAFEEMAGYKDSAEQIGNIYRLQGIQKMGSESYEEALALFEKAARSVDVSKETDECYYRLALIPICRGKSGGKEWLAKISDPSAFPDYADLMAFCDLNDTLIVLSSDGVSSQAQIAEFETALAQIEEIVTRLTVDVTLSDTFSKLSKNIAYYGKYLTEAGEYTTLYSDGSGGGYATLTVDTQGLMIYGIGPKVWLTDGETSKLIQTTSTTYYDARVQFLYTILGAGHVQVDEIIVKGRHEKTHFIIPEN